MRYCANCNSPMDEDAKFCQQCGTRAASFAAGANAAPHVPGSAAPVPPPTAAAGVGPDISPAPGTESPPAGPVPPAPLAPPAPGAPVGSVPPGQAGPQAPGYAPPPVPPYAPLPGGPSRKKPPIIPIIIAVAAVCFLVGGIILWEVSRLGIEKPESSSSLSSSSEELVSSPESESGSQSSSPPADPPAIQPPAVGEGGAIPANYFQSYQSGDVSHVFSTSGVFAQMGEQGSSYLQTIDGLYCYYFTNQSDTYQTDLHVLSALGEARFVAENAQNPALCSNPDIIYYQAGNRGTDLYRYTFSEDKAELMATDVSNYSVSPNGAYLLFSNREYISYMPAGEAPTRLLAQKDSIAIAISNDGATYSFCVTSYDGGETENRVYFGHTNTDEPETSFTYYGYRCSLAVNATGDDFLLLSPDGLFRYSENGLETVSQVGNELLTLVEPNLAAPQRRDSNLNSKIYAVSSFSSFFFQVEDNTARTFSLHYRGADGQVQKVDDTQGPYNTLLSADLSRYFYRRDDGLWLAQVTEDGVETRNIAEDAYQYSASPDGTTVLYTTYDRDTGRSGILCMLDVDSGIKKEIDDDVSFYWLGGPKGTSITYIKGGKPYDGVGGEGFLYTEEDGSVLIAGDVVDISPPTASHSFYICSGAKAKPGNSGQNYVELSAWDGTALRSIASGVEVRYSLYDKDWFYRFTRPGY